jgi:hypothetical protein
VTAAPPAAAVQAPAQAPVSAPVHESKKTKSAERRKINAPPSTSPDKEKAAAASGAAVASTDSTPNTPPPSEGSAAATNAAVPELPPAAGLPDPGVGLNQAPAAAPAPHRVAWIPIGVLALGIAGAVALVLSRRRNAEDISIVDRTVVASPPPVRPMPRHS